MIILDGSAEFLQAVLSGAVSSDQPEFQVSFGRVNAVDLETYDSTDGELNSTTDVNLLSGVASKQVLVKSVDVFNKDNAAVTITFKKQASGTDRFLYLATLDPNESVHYQDGRGWYVCDDTGAEKMAGGAGGAADGFNRISAGTQIAGTNATVLFENSNGISFGMSGSTRITASHNALTSQSNQAFSADASSTFQTLTFQDSNGVSFSNNAGALRVTHALQFTSATSAITSAALHTSAALRAIYDGANSISTGTIRFTNANGVSFSINGQTISGSVAAQTNQSVGLYALGNTTQNSSTTLDARSLSFNGLGIVTVGYSNGSIQISATEVAQTNQSVGLYGVGNTTQNSSTTLDARTISYGGRGDITVGFSNGTVQISGNQTNQSVGLYGVGNTTQNSSTTLDARTLSFGGRGDITVGFSNGTMQISGSQTAQTQSNVQGIIVSDTTYRTGDVSFSNLNGISFGSNGANVVTASYTVPSVPAQFLGGFSTNGNTAGDTGLVTGRLNLIGGNNITLSGSTNGGSISVTISAGAGGAAQTGISGIEVSNTTYTSGTVTFRNANGISFGSSGANGISASYTVPTQSNQTLGMYATGNTTQNSSTTFDARTLGTINASGGVTVGFSNGSIQVSGPFSATTISGVTSGNVVGTRGSRFALEDHQHEGVYAVGFSTNGNTAGDTALRPGRLVLVGGNNITLSGATAANSLQTITISGPNTVAQTNQTVGLYGVGNTTQNSSTTLDARTISYGGRGDITVGFSNGTVQISGSQSNQQMTMFATGNTVLSSTGTSNASSLIFRGSGAASVGITNGSVLIDVAAGAAAITQSIGMSTQTAGGSAAGTTGYATGDDVLYHFVPGSNITMSQSINGASGTLSIYGPAAGGGITLSGFIPDFQMDVTRGQLNASLCLEPRLVQQPFQYDHMVMPLHYSQATNSTLTVSNSIYWGFYTRNANTLSLVTSSSGSFSINGSGTASSASNSGIRIVSFGDTQTITAGDYVFGYVWRSSTAGANASLSNICCGGIASSISGYIGSATNSRLAMIVGRGIWTSTTAGMPNSVALSDVRGQSSAANRFPGYYFTSGQVTF